MKQCVRSRLGIPIANLLLLRRAGAKIEVAEDGRRTLGPGVTAVVITQSKSQRQVLSGLPSVFHKEAKSPGGSIPVPQLLRSGVGVVHDAVFVGRSILCKLEQVIEGELGLRPRSLEGLNVVSIPSFIPELQRVCAPHMGKHVAPVIVVLNEVALSETDTVCLAAI